MSLPPAPPPDGYVSSADACRVLGISDRTLRRRVQAGEINGEYVARPQGSVLYVKLPQAAQDGEEAASTRQDAAIVALFLEQLAAKDTALLAATERAARAEVDRDHLAQQLAAERAAREAAERKLEARRWWRFW